MHQLFGNAGSMGWVALKALFLYLTAIACFRIGSRRAITEMTPFDFAAAVAVGAIIGRVPNSSTTSYLAGAVTLVTVLAAHELIERLRLSKNVENVIDPPKTTLLVNGDVLENQRKKAGFTRRDIERIARSQGIKDLNDIECMIFESGGQVSVIRR